MSPRGPVPWAPNLATERGRRALADRIARSPAVVVRQRDLGPGAPDPLPPRRPQLVVGVDPDHDADVLTLDHVVLAHERHGTVLRRRLAVARFDRPDDPAMEAAVVSWSILATQHAELVALRLARRARARRLAGTLRP